jgi:peptide/nickel transport system ATP-binding protein
VLTVKGLTVTHKDSFHERNIVEDISFILKPGEALGIVGESGSGKTITALSVLQLLPPGMRISAGQIFLEAPAYIDGGKSGNVEDHVKQTSENSMDLATFGEKQMQAVRGKVISMVFQEPMTSLNPSMRCSDQIREAVKIHRGSSPADAREIVFSLMEEVRLPFGREFFRKYPHQLSGGQRQRIMIAMALAGNPRILIADEPTTALDLRVQRKILDLLQEILHNRRMGLLFISHDLGVIRSVCKNALVMYRGNIVESGPVSRLFSRPEHPYTRGLIACRPVPGSNPYRLPTLTDFMDPAGTVKKVTAQQTDRSTGDSPAGEQLSGDRSNVDNSTVGSLSGDRLSVGSLSGDHPVSEGSPVPLLEVKDLQIDYTLKKNLLGKPVRSLRAVDNFTFHIARGETVGLIGESGCGKSTLGQSLIRLIQTGAGEIRYRGAAISSFRGKDLGRFRQKVQFIFQDPYSSLNPRMAVGPAIMEVMRVHGIHRGKSGRKQATLELLDRVGLLAEHFSRYPHEFSGGQRQRIGLARALATGPELIICDESVSSLDVSVQAMILNLLNDLKESFSLTYLFISHDLSVVRYMSDRILVMKDGKLVEEGSGEQVFLHPSADYTRDLVDSILI